MATILQIASLNQKEVERYFAATVSRYPGYAVQQCSWLEPERILDPQVRSYWAKVRAGVSADLDDEQAMVVESQCAVESGLHVQLGRWSMELYDGATPQGLAKEIVRRAYIAAVLTTSAKLVNAARQADDDQSRLLITELSELSINGGTIIPNTAQIAEKFSQALISNGLAIKTRVGGLDEALGGLERKTQIAIAGRPSTGKTALALQIARNVAIDGLKVVFFSLEMSDVGLWARMACPLVGVSWKEVLGGALTPEQKKQLLEESERLAATYQDVLYLDDRSHTTSSMRQVLSELNPDLVVVDHIRLAKDKGDNEVKRLGQITENLHDMAKTYDVAMIAAVQLNRSLEYRPDKRPILADLRASGEIEENIDVCLMMYSDDMYNPPDPPRHVHPIEVWVRKFRNGTPNIRIDLDFDGQQQWFEKRQ